MDLPPRIAEERSLVRGDEEFCFDCSVKRWMGGGPYPENMGRYLFRRVSYLEVDLGVPAIY